MPVVTTWTIRQLADEYAVSLRTLRHYEDLGLLHPVRVGVAREYHQRDRIRLELILRGKRVGFSLDEISVIVNMYDEPPGEAGQLNYLIDQCDVRRRALEQQRRDIDATIADLDGIEARCREDLGQLVGRKRRRPSRDDEPPAHEAAPL
ncbi:MerR family DNA-binding transcriptional regulator [Nocardioides sp. JQ2195]|uniref:MerR family transcriptional regulator n=1 Tax=Nocardioides sp. JQ2195 TaxID=2592334 RepID=UPI00143EC5A3|nr:MerR family DNA-binding transcriptional regulator [Nocardioides sp. JQ2195]QIX25912.1 MerR family DNA-binding transcriptional regulator [Nocardioides sp. JQ2195]